METFSVSTIKVKIGQGAFFPVTQHCSGKLMDTVQNGVQAQRNRFKQAIEKPPRRIELPQEADIPSTSRSVHSEVRADYRKEQVATIRQETLKMQALFYAD
ncbi:hypothetical protein T07_4558 [Trichinella nelsoni]|uniref:Uncharacterized protein n=1 Tax=Trichinella nelsoni TaxID=6336 RepID=A0A0V0SP95_9BILA|nr:hypothetical protein T07_4558 [Trichinella nelsoni]